MLSFVSFLVLSHPYYWIDARQGCGLLVDDSRSGMDGGGYSLIDSTNIVVGSDGMASLDVFFPQSTQWFATSTVPFSSHQSDGNRGCVSFAYSTSMDSEITIRDVPPSSVVDVGYATGYGAVINYKRFVIEDLQAPPPAPSLQQSPRPPNLPSPLPPNSPYASPPSSPGPSLPRSPNPSPKSPSPSHPSPPCPSPAPSSPSPSRALSPPCPSPAPSSPSLMSSPGPLMHSNSSSPSSPSPLSSAISPSSPSQTPPTTEPASSSGVTIALVTLSVLLLLMVLAYGLWRRRDRRPHA